MTQYGPGLLDDSGRLRAVLSTLLPGRQRHVSALVAAVEDRIPAQLRANHSRGESAQAAITRLAESLADNRALDPAAALASVRSIAEALDIPGAASVELPRPRPAAAGQPVGQGSSQPVGQPTQPSQSAQMPPGNAGSPPGAYPPAPPIGPPRGGGYSTESPIQIVNFGPHDAGRRPPGPPGQKAGPPPVRKKRRPLLWVLAGVIALVLVGAGVIVAVAVADLGDKPQPKPPVAKPTASKPTASKAPRAVSCTYVAAQPGKGGPVPRKVTPPPSDNVSATGTVAMQMATNKGSLVLTLDRAAAPCSVNNFVSLASQKWYDDTPCHRLTTEAFYVLQCGDPLGTGLGGPGYAFADENLPAKASAFVTYSAGTVAIATATANANGAQFFIVYRDSRLPAAFSIFGKVTSGLDIVQDIAAGGSTPPGDGKPTSPVVIESVSPES